ncbi:uracil-DNA glycosylase [Spiroplasma taiwanense]|uniref:Uracil-DNA glycosylase n=1 Tax=Spiroplasma taiwanense CT-1 TaxID=1276220 RepID=S5MFT9_9MOLU|nr:uracil-DNA glycosylase [Spiroplasma taiwanense]AGR40725.1 uracil-DNA glycosylase [Spiroplasma taiwanense CT-1]
MKSYWNKTEIFEKIDIEWIQIFKKNGIKNDIFSIFSKIKNINNIFPEPQEIFSVFKLIKPSEIKVIILGQDPYHGENQANGIAFSVSNRVKTPPSLRNIFKELKNDLGISHFENNDLSMWVKQGVFLLNTSLTVEKGLPNSHKNLGWNNVIIKILKAVNEFNNNIIYCLWGNYAKNLYNNLINGDNKIENCIFSSHPSPFSYKNGFENSKPFSKINDLLVKKNQKAINWQL